MNVKEEGCMDDASGNSLYIFEAFDGMNYMFYLLQNYKKQIVAKRYIMVKYIKARPIQRIVNGLFQYD